MILVFNIPQALNAHYVLKCKLSRRGSNWQNKPFTRLVSNVQHFYWYNLNWKIKINPHDRKRKFPHIRKAQFPKFLCFTVQIFSKFFVFPIFQGKLIFFMISLDNLISQKKYAENLDFQGWNFKSQQNIFSRG